MRSASRAIISSRAVRVALASARPTLDALGTALATRVGACGAESVASGVADALDEAMVGDMVSVGSSDCGLQAHSADATTMRNTITSRLLLVTVAGSR
jgi:hypothetical protein